MRNLLVASAPMRRAVGLVVSAALSGMPATGTVCPTLCRFLAHHDVAMPAAAASPHDGHGSHHDPARLAPPFSAEQDGTPVLAHRASPIDDPAAEETSASVAAATCCCPRTESALIRPARAVRIDAGTAAPTPAALLVGSFQMPGSHPRGITRQRLASAPPFTPPQIVLRV